MHFFAKTLFFKDQLRFLGLSPSHTFDIIHVSYLFSHPTIKFQTINGKFVIRRKIKFLMTPSTFCANHIKLSNKCTKTLAKILFSYN